jgi:hypothetical protein
LVTPTSLREGLIGHTNHAGQMSGGRFFSTLSSAFDGAGDITICGSGTHSDLLTLIDFKKNSEVQVKTETFC